MTFVHDWNQKTLGNLCKITTGKKDVNEGNPDGEFPFFTCSRWHTYSDSYSFDTEAILIAGNGEVGNLHYYRGKFEAYQRTYVLDRFDVDSHYVFHYIESFLKPTLLRSHVGSTIPFIKLGDLTDFEIQIPVDKQEQTQIAAILSTVDKAIEQTEALIAKQQRIKTGLMQDLLTRGIDEQGHIRSEATHAFKDSPLERIPVEWEPRAIGKVAALQRGYDIVESNFVDGPYPVISSSGIIGYHDSATCKGPNVVVGRKGSIGNVHYVSHDFWAHDTSLFVTNFFDNNEKYVFFLFKFLDLGRYGTKSGSPSLNRNDIHPLIVGVPNREEQGRIAFTLSTHDKVIDDFSRTLQKYILHEGIGDNKVTSLKDWKLSVSRESSSAL